MQLDCGAIRFPSGSPILLSLDLASHHLQLLSVRPTRQCVQTVEQFLREPSAYTVINTNSPFKLDGPMGMGIIEMARRNQACVVTPFTLAGAMAPVTLAGALVEQNAEVVQASQPKTRFNRCGYLLHDVLTQDHLELGRLLVGSEGTLALFTEATLRTVPLPVGRSLVLLGFDTLDTALRASQRALPSNPAACELIDRRLESDSRVVRLDVPLTDGKTLAWIYQRGEVLGRRDDNEAAHISARLAEEDIARLRHRRRLH